MGLRSFLSSINPFADEIPQQSPLTLDAAAAQARAELAILPPIDVGKQPKKPGKYEEPSQIPYIGGIHGRKDQCCTSWDPPLAKFALNQLDGGGFAQAGLMMEEMLRDDAVYHGYISRSGRLFGLPQRYMESTKRGGARAQRVWARHANLIFPNGLKREIMKYLYFFKFCLCSITWLNVPNLDEDGPAFWRIPQFKAWHPYFLRFIFGPQKDADDGGIGGALAGGHYQVITYNMGSIDLIGENAPGAGRWVIFQGAGARPWLDAMIRPLASPWMRRVYTRRDHGRFEERHGLPIIKVHYPVHMGGENKEWQAFEESLLNLGSDGLLHCPRDPEHPEAGVDANFIGPPNATAVTSFVESKKEEDRDIYTLWLGQSLTTEAGQGGGLGHGKGQLDGQERRVNDKARDDSSVISDAEVEWYNDADGEERWHMIPADGPIRQQVGRYFAWYNFGNPDLAPFDFIDATPESDRRAAAEIAQMQGLRHQRMGSAAQQLMMAAKELQAQNAKFDLAYLMEQIGFQLTRPPEDETQDRPHPGLTNLRRIQALRQRVTMPPRLRIEEE